MFITSEIAFKLEKQVKAALRAVRACIEAGVDENDPPLVNIHENDLDFWGDHKDETIKIFRAARVASPKREVRGAGTASIPIALEVPTFLIGGFGSVWADVEVEGRMVRISFNPNNGRFYLDFIGE